VTLLPTDWLSTATRAAIAISVSTTAEFASVVYYVKDIIYPLAFFLSYFPSFPPIIVYLLFVNHVGLTLTLHRFPPSLHIQPSLHPSLLLRTNRLFSYRRTSRSQHPPNRAPPLNLFLSIQSHNLQATT